MKENYLFDQVFHKVLVYTDELSCQDSSGVDVGSVWLKSLIIAENLTGTCSWHWSNQETVSHTESEKILFDSFPIVTALMRLVVPEIELQKTLGSWRALERVIGSVPFGDLNGFADSSIINGLKYFFVQFGCF